MNSLQVLIVTLIQNTEHIVVIVEHSCNFRTSFV